MTPTDTGPALAAVCIGRTLESLASVVQPGVELAAWTREPDPRWTQGLDALPLDAWPACRLQLAPDEARAALNASFDTCGTPRSQARAFFIDDVIRLVACFATLARTPGVRLRLDVVTGDACRRWHRDCVPLRLVCTYRGPGTQWVPPVEGAAVLSRPDDDTPQAMSFQAGDVAVFKGCGWPGHPHEGGIVHRSPRIAGTGVARLVLVLDAAWPLPAERRS